MYVALLKFFLRTLSYLALPCAWIETLLFYLFRLDTSTSFRMFPNPATFPADPSVADVVHLFALDLIYSIPSLVTSDRSMDGRATLGKLLRPLTRRVHPRGEFVIMFARVWLCVACSSAFMSQFMMGDLDVPLFSLKIGCLFFIL